MTELKKRKAPDLKSRIPLSFLTGFAGMVAVMLLLPLMQHLSIPGKPPHTDDWDTDAIPPPKDFIVPPPPPPVSDEEEITLEQEKPKQLQLTHLDVFFNPDVKGHASTDWTVPSGFGPSSSDVVHWIGDLTNPPHPVRRPQPLYPADLRRLGIEGTVIVMFVVRSDGTVSNIEIERSTHRAFGESVKRSVRKWHFEPGEKDGKAVHTRVRQAIPFRIN